MADERRDQVNVRLEADDREALDRVLAAVRERVGPGIGVGASDAIRWAIHTCDALLQREALEEAEGV